MVKNLLTADVEFFRPVAMFAGFSSRAKIFNRGFYGFRVGMERHGIQLPHAGNFCFYIPGGTRTNVTLNAFYLGVRRITPGGVFRLHDHVTEFTAEGGRFGELKTLDGGDRYNNNEKHAGQDEEDEHMTTVRIIQIQAGELRYLLFK